MNDPATRPVRRVGDRGVLVECADGQDARGLLAALQAQPPSDVVDVVAGARTVLVRTRRPVGRDLLADLSRRPAADPAGHRVTEVTVDVVYDGADLAAVAAVLGTGEEAVVARHVATRWTAAFLGFAPGFAYLEPDVRGGEVPRRDEPRTRVPPGAVALAGRWSAVYPRSSPGGWQLIGRTDHVLWDPAADPPAALTAGTVVRFRAVRPSVHAGLAGPGSAPREDGPVTTMAAATSALEVLGPGRLTVVEDLGRAGRQSWGVPTSGALDRGAAVRANRLVGNHRRAAVLETLGDLVLRPTTDVVIALTGAPAPMTCEDGSGVTSSTPGGRPVRVAAGTCLRVGLPAAGARAYLAVRGGIASPPVLGSRSTDLLSDLGPRPLALGDLVPVGTDVQDSVALVDDDAPLEVDVPAGGMPADGVPTDEAAVVRVVPGPRDDWFADGVATLRSTRWRVTPDANRVGLRLDGGTVVRSRQDELESEPMVPGAIQVPPGGRPVVLLADHPTTGGYPVVAVVVTEDLDRLAQLAPGDPVRFVTVD